MHQHLIHTKHLILEDQICTNYLTPNTKHHILEDQICTRYQPNTNQMNQDQDPNMYTNYQHQYQTPIPDTIYQIPNTLLAEAEKTNSNFGGKFKFENLTVTQ